MAVRHEGPGHLHTAGPHAPTRASTRGHDIFRPPAFASRSSDSRRGSWALLTVGLPAQAAGPRRGYRVPHARAATGVGALYTPRTSGAHPAGVDSPTGACRFPAASPCTPPRHPIMRGSRLTRHQRGFTSRSPVRSSPRLWPPGWNGQPFGFPPGFAPRRHRRRTSGWGQAIEHGPGTTAQLTSVDLQSGSSLNACDLASHVAEAALSARLLLLRTIRRRQLV